MADSCDFPRIGKPCPSCPWRVDKDARHIPNFDLEKAEGLAQCCPDSRGFGPSFGSSMFACHQCFVSNYVPSIDTAKSPVIPTYDAISATPH